MTVTTDAPVMSGYESAVRRIGATLAAALDSLWERYRAGAISQAEFADLGAIMLATGNAQAAQVARLSLAAYVTEQTGRALDVRPVAVPAHHTSTARLARALSTIATAPEGAPARLARLAIAEPSSAGAKTYGAGVRSTPGARGWVRGRDSDPCQLCTWWWRQGRVWPMSHSMPEHKGCCCVPLPTFTGDRPRAVQF